MNEIEKKEAWQMIMDIAREAGFIRFAYAGFAMLSMEKEAIKENENTKELKLYIWDDFEPDYTEGLAFAIAETEDEARKLVEEERGYEVFHWGDVEVKFLSKCAQCVSGGS